MKTAARLQVLGALFLAIAGALIHLALGFGVAGVLALAFGIALEREGHVDATDVEVLDDADMTDAGEG